MSATTLPSIVRMLEEMGVTERGTGTMGERTMGGEMKIGVQREGPKSGAMAMLRKMIFVTSS